LRSSELPVLIHGEIGTGKEMVARVLHEESPRAPRPFCVIDCSTLPPQLLEAELFGARKGAFTDMSEDRDGLLVTADGGTVFIEEVAAIPLEAQAKLVGVLGEGSFRPLGQESECRVNVRVIASTSHDLDLDVREGALRADLLYRIRVVTIEVPPLRER